MEIFREEREYREAIGNRLRTDPEALWKEVEHAARRSLRAEKEKNVSDAFAVECGALLDRLEALCRALCDRLPHAGTFFASGTSGEDPYLQVCAFLRGLEEGTRQLHGVLRSGKISDAPETIRCRLHAEMLCAELKKCGGETATRAEKIEEKLEADRLLTEALLAETGRKKESLESFCAQTVPAFCENLGKAADAMHGGKGLRTQSVTALCGEMIFAIGTLKKEIGYRSGRS